MAAGGGKLWVDKRGSGTPVLFVHGLGGTGNVYEPQVRGLGEGFRTIRVDLSGAGRSPLAGPLSLDRWADDVAAALDGDGVGKAHLVGHSLGTRVVQQFAARHPARVLSLALIGVTAAPAPERKQVVLDRAVKVRQAGMEAITEAVIGNALAPASLEGKPAVIAFVRELLMRQDPEGYAQTCEASAAGEPPDLSRLDCRFLLIAGRDDKVSPVAASEAFAQKLPRAALEVLEECGHWHTIEQPAKVTAALRTFLRAA
jgi:pimeloyl-ACP methyl ester carboxylesterase